MSLAGFYLCYVGPQLLGQLDSFAVSHMVQHLLNLWQRGRSHPYAQAPAAQGVYHLQSHSNFSEQRLRETFRAVPAWQLLRVACVSAQDQGTVCDAGHQCKDVEQTSVSKWRALDTLEQEKMSLQVEEYFSIVLRRLCCASLDSLSTSFSSSIL